ncbi:MAG: glutamine--fructose-6-phosphate transaminase (isomerizing) [archaeon]
MCGIIGYFGKKDALKILIDGLKKVEYRGYDSAGVAILKEGKLFVKKVVGKVEDLEKSLDFSNFDSELGIGHTRWATHGKVSIENAHPHLDCSEKIAIVHNGIIENYLELRKELIEKGHIFKSETDSEVIAHLIEENMKRLDFEDACIAAFNRLVGSFAILAIYADKEKIVGVRKDSPLVLGLKNFKKVSNFEFFSEETFVGSDIYALLSYTNDFLFLQNFDIVVLEKGKVRLIGSNSNVERIVEKITANLDIGKGDFHHYMIKEILEEGDVFVNAFNQEESKIRKIAEELKNSKKVVFVAAGTSHHATLIAEYLFTSLGIYTKTILASEFPHNLPLVDDSTLVVAVSQSGETADVIEAVKLAKSKGARVVSIVNVYESTIYREGDEKILMNAGPEVGVAATKTYIAELAIFLRIYSELSKVYINPLEVRAKILETLGRSRREFIEKLAKKLKDSKSIFLIGRGIEYPLALEAALKIKEISYIHAEAFAGGEIKHGTIALIEKDTPCFVFEGDEEIYSNAQELKARGAHIIGVGPKNHPVFDIWIKTPEHENLSFIFQIIPMQLLAYLLAVEKGLDPDKPRNLAKSVTVK